MEKLDFAEGEEKRYIHLDTFKLLAQDTYNFSKMEGSDGTPYEGIVRFLSLSSNLLKRY